jgi:hypothetical protein
VARLCFDWQWLPYHPALLEAQGVTATLMRELEEAGFVSGQRGMITPGGADVTYRWGKRMLAVQRTAGVELPVYALQRAGADLCRVAEVERDPEYFMRVAEWIHAQRSTAIVGWAELPDARWAGREQQLQWHAIGGAASGIAN